MHADLKHISTEIKSHLADAKNDYASAKAQAIILDELLGYDGDSIEHNLFEKNKDTSVLSPQQFWFGLDIQSLQTPYSEVVEMIQHFNPQPGDVWLDLGAAYGRVGVVLGFLCPMVQFIGYEYVPERVDEGNRIFKKWNLTQAELKRVNLASDGFELREADLYFIYDFGSKNDIYKVLEKLRLIAMRKPIQVVARGRGVRNWITMDFPWLGVVNPPKHFAHWTVFQS